MGGDTEPCERPPQELDSLEDLTKSASAAALHGLDKAETKRKMEALLERIDSLAKVWGPAVSAGPCAKHCFGTLFGGDGPPCHGVSQGVALCRLWRVLNMTGASMRRVQGFLSDCALCFCFARVTGKSVGCVSQEGLGFAVFWGELSAAVAVQSTDVSMEALDTLVAREVPVEWYGVASQVVWPPLPQHLAPICARHAHAAYSTAAVEGPRL